MDKLLLATGNEGKVRELRQLLQHLEIEVVSLKDLNLAGDAPETGQSFLENAIQKATYYQEKTGLAVVADDSGLEVDALDRQPGIHSARFGGFETHKERRIHLLELLQDVPKPKRTARFRCVAVFFDGSELVWSSGAVEGFIGYKDRGNKGFGYDPVFSQTLDGPTFAQISSEEKNACSHRAVAFKNLISKEPFRTS